MGDMRRTALILCLVLFCSQGCGSGQDRDQPAIGSISAPDKSDGASLAKLRKDAQAPASKK
jgi:hypothetical protein